MLLASRTWGASSSPPALLVHGGGVASYTWDQVGSWLGNRGWHAIAVDLRGHGRSTTPAGTSDFSLKELSADLIETVATIRPDVTSIDLLIGHSLGAVVSLTCIAESPLFARRLVLEDPPGESRLTKEGRFAAAEVVRASIEAARADPAALADQLLATVSRDMPAEVTARVEALAAADPVYVPEVVRGMAGLDIIDLAERCTAPTLLVVGRDEGTPNTATRDNSRSSVLSGEDRVRFTTALRQVTVVELDAGHDLHEPVFSDFVAELENWLSKTGTNSA